MVADGEGYILVVDDDEDIRVTIQQILEEEGYATLAAANGEEALRVIRSQARRPRLVLLDVMMPVMDGPRFQAKLAEDPGLAAVPVVILSAGGHAPMRSGAGRAAGYLDKPVDLSTLIGTVRSLA
jgi:CheY-like chemotaxis protein